MTPPHVDIAAGFFFSGETIVELAANIKSKYQRKPMAASVLEKTVVNYNSYVDAGKDPDFGKPTPKYKIQTPPFYAGLVDAGHPRYARRTQDQHEMPGGRSLWQHHTRSLLWR